MAISAPGECQTISLLVELSVNAGLLLVPSVNATAGTERQRYCCDRASTILLVYTECLRYCLSMCQRYSWDRPSALRPGVETASIGQVSALATGTEWCQVLFPPMLLLLLLVFCSNQLVKLIACFCVILRIKCLVQNTGLGMFSIFV